MRPKKKKREKEWDIHEHSKYKMVVYFKNKAAKKTGKKDEPSYFYSFDWKSAYIKEFYPEKGLAWFHKRIAEWGKKANYIMIYERETDTEIERYFEGHRIR